eukprot:TRINITY_DN19689_c0_g1_i1.p1 TRINITY_DN19689_c0_g1~~TRINITY_DN19689_c0_g1_i1.p1  ORF type:complete len:352 (-),score=55.39 TRINITY_DN19689_c0_g1_i1:51-1106(-)
MLNGIVPIYNQSQLLVISMLIRLNRRLNNFSLISKKPVNPAKREFFELPDNTEPLIGIASDAEARNTMVTVFIKQKTDINEPKNLGYLRTSIQRSLISSMMNARYSELIQKPNPPFVFAGFAIGSLVRTRDVVYLYSAAKNDNVTDGVKGLIREAQRIKQFGFTATELERMKADYLRGLENQLKEKDKEKNEKYVNECVNNFLENEPIPGIQFEYMFAAGVLPSISIDEINAYAKSMITEQNLVITINAPKKDGIKLPIVDEVSKAIKDVYAEKLEAYVDKVSNKPLVENLASVGKVTVSKGCLLYTSDAADDMQCVDLGGRRIIKKKKKMKTTERRIKICDALKKKFESK